MSIDADVRSGLIDFQTARKKREDLQTESRFYGSLDGAMKFVKGDAIAGILITLVNVLGGLAVGILLGGLRLGEALTMYTLLTVGDGLVSQIPALLSAVAAGIVITRVVHEDRRSLVVELLEQLGQVARVKVVIGVAFVGIAMVPAMPAFPFLFFAGFLFVSTLAATVRHGESVAPASFQPKTPALIEIRLAMNLQASTEEHLLFASLEEVRETVFRKDGLILLLPDVTWTDTLQSRYEILIRGLVVASGVFPEAGASEATQPSSLEAFTLALCNVVRSRRIECIDDVLTRRTLDHFDRVAPELVSAVVPGAISVTQLTKILKSLTEEEISIRNFDVILQAIAEHAGPAPNERTLLEEVRIALKRLITDQFADANGAIRGYTLDPTIELALVNAERRSELIDPILVQYVDEALGACESNDQMLVVSRSARRLLFEELRGRGRIAQIVAHEELAPEKQFIELGEISVPNEVDKEQILDAIAA